MMYPMLDPQKLMALYRQQPMQFQQQQWQEQRPQQPQGGGGGGMNMGQMYEQFTGNKMPSLGEMFQGGGQGGWGGMFSPAVGGEAAPIGGVGSYAGAAAPAEGLGSLGAGAAEGMGAGAAGAAEGLGAAGAGAAEGLGALGAGAAEGIGALGAGAGEGIMGLIGLLGMMFSDPKVKENKAKVGQLYDGTPVWSYNYIGDHVPRIGLMANEVRPDAVYDIGGVKAVHYGKATEDARAIGGILGNLGA
jgi:hypothetical protein